MGVVQADIKTVATSSTAKWLDRRAGLVAVICLMVVLTVLGIQVEVLMLFCLTFILLIC
jgi:hypothetical protein